MTYKVIIPGQDRLDEIEFPSLVRAVREVIPTGGMIIDEDTQQSVLVEILDDMVQVRHLQHPQIRERSELRMLRNVAVQVKRFSRKPTYYMDSDDRIVRI